MTHHNTNISDLLETNRRLNRRCQHAESLIIKYRKRYVAIQNPLEKAHNRIEGWVHQLKLLYYEEHKYRFRYCMLCRLKWWVKQKILRW